MNQLFIRLWGSHSADELLGAPDLFRFHLVLSLTLTLSLTLIACANAYAQSKREGHPQHAQNSQNRNWTTPPEEDNQSHSNQLPGLMSRMSLGAQEVARDLDIVEFLGEYEHFQALALSDPSVLRKPDCIALKQQLLESLVRAIVEIQVVEGDLDEDITRFNELRSFLEERRERAVRKNNITNFLTNGATQIISSAFQISPKLAPNVAGNTVGVVGGTAVTGLSAYAVKQAQGDRRSLSAHPNMLAVVFEIDGQERVNCPLFVADFLNDTPPGSFSNDSRRQILIKRWVQVRRIDDPAFNGDSARRIKLLAGTVPQVGTVNIDLLDDRTAMLADVRATVVQASKYLLEIMNLIGRPPLKVKRH